MKTCGFDGCDRRHAAKGLCAGHYQQQYLGRELTPFRDYSARVVGQVDCNVDGCPKPHHATGLCTKHYAKFWKHGITGDQYEEMLRQQGGACAICGTTTPGGNGDFHVDHDHNCCDVGVSEKKCGSCIRGLLCSHCNVGLGHFRDDPNKLMAAVAYLLQSDQQLNTNQQREVAQ